jgi:4-azaleucine resistance transporter AzlC
MLQEHELETGMRQADRRAAWCGELRAGFVMTLPLWLGVAPFGAIYAVSAHAAGLSAAQTMAMSLLVFAGAAQFTSLGLFAAGVAPFAIVLTTLVVNARLLLMGTSLARYLAGSPWWQRALAATQLTDESYAIGMGRFMAGQGSLAYQLGSNISVYVIWQASTLCGLLLGALAPDPAAYGLDLVFPLTFIGLLMPLLRQRMRSGERRSVVVAGCAAALALTGAALLPGKWYLLLAGLGASALGAAINREGREEVLT